MAPRLLVLFSIFYSLFSVVLAGEVSFAERADALFAIGSPTNRISPADCGLVNGHITFNGWLGDAAEVRGLFAPPYHSADFTLAVQVNGEKVRATSHLWRPEVLRRTGTNDNWRVTSHLYPVAHERAGILEVEVENVSGQARDLRVDCQVSGGTSFLEKWQFGKPRRTAAAKLRREDWGIVLDGVTNDVQVAVSLPGDANTLAFRDVPPGARKRFFVCFALGRTGEAAACAKRLRRAPETVLAQSVADWRRRVQRLFERFPAWNCCSSIAVRSCICCSTNGTCRSSSCIPIMPRAA